VARQVRVAVARIDALPLARARRTLGPRDRRRYARFRSEKRRREFLAGRAVLQRLGVKFDSAADGGIRAQGRAGASVSHARGWVAGVVVSSGQPGIDIEPMIERDFAKLGEWQFGKAPDARAHSSYSRREFYEQWTRYEARIKAFGDGKPRASHIERTWFLYDRVALSVCVPASFASASVLKWASWSLRSSRKRCSVSGR
jgi:phosphopantetheinyl transferase